MFTCKKLTWQKCGVRYQIWNSSHYNSVVTSKASHMMIHATIKSQSDLYVYIYFGVPLLAFWLPLSNNTSKAECARFFRWPVCHRVEKRNLWCIAAKYSWKWNQLLQDSNCEAVILDLSRRSWISSLAFCMATDNCTFRSCEILSTLRAHSWQVNQSSIRLSQSTADAPKWISPKIIHIGIKLKLVGHLTLFRYNISHLSWKLVQTVPQLVLYLCFDLAAQTIPNVLSAHTHGEMPWRTLDGCGVLGMQLSNGERVSNFTIKSDLYDLQSMIKYDSK